MNEKYIKMNLFDGSDNLYIHENRTFKQPPLFIGSSISNNPLKNKRVNDPWHREYFANLTIKDRQNVPRKNISFERNTNIFFQIIKED